MRITVPVSDIWRLIFAKRTSVGGGGMRVGAMRRIVTAVVMLAVAMAMVMASSVHNDCSSAVNDLSPFKPCMPAVVGVTPALPSAECCDAVKKADLNCLCTAVSSSTVPDLNPEAAIMLPKKCGVIPPGLSTCAKHGNPFARKPMDLR